MQTSFWKNIIRLAFLLLLQTLVLEHISWPGNLHLLVYPIALILLPMQLPNVALILLAFGYGWLVDICCGTPGLNAASAVFMMFCRIVYFKVNDVRDILHDSELQGSPLPSNLGWGGFAVYAAWMVAAFHIFYFMLQAGSFHHFPYTLFLTAGSGLLCYLAQLLVVWMFAKKGNTR